MLFFFNAKFCPKSTENHDFVPNLACFNYIAPFFNEHFQTKNFYLVGMEMDFEDEMEMELSANGIYIYFLESQIVTGSLSTKVTTPNF